MASFPGVTVNWSTRRRASRARRRLQRPGRVQLRRPCQPGHVHGQGHADGFKTYENKGVRIGAQQFITLDIGLEVGQLQETITVTGQAPLIETSNASTGASHRLAAAETLPSGGRVGVPVRGHGPDRRRVGRRAVQPPAGSDQRVAAVARRRHAPRQQLPAWTACRSPTCATARRRIPTIEALEEVNVQVHTYDAETGRTGGGMFNVATKSGTNVWHGSGFYQNRPKWGRGTTSSRSSPASPARYLLPPRRRRLRRPDHHATARSSGPRSKATARTRRVTAPCASRPAASGAATSRRASNAAGTLVVDLRPADRRSGDRRRAARRSPGNIIPADRHQSGGARHGRLSSDPTPMSATAAPTSTAPRRSTIAPTCIPAKSITGSATRSR